MSYLDNCTDLWYLMKDFFHDNKCCNGLIKHDTNYYQFQKNKTIFCVRRIRDNFYKLRVIRRYKKEQDTRRRINNIYIPQSLAGTINGAPILAVNPRNKKPDKQTKYYYAGNAEIDHPLSRKRTTHVIERHPHALRYIIATSHRLFRPPCTRYPKK